MTEALRLLAERVEKASGPDRGLDQIIRDTLGACISCFCMTPLCRDRPEGFVQPCTPRYTASLDAAMSLVPPGHEWGCGSWGNPDTDGPWAWCATKQQSHDNDLDYGKSATPALALCAAALRARAAQEQRNEP